MPITPEYSWQETETSVSVTVKATGLSKAKADLLICDNFVRVNCAPYLLQLDLLHHVNEADCTAVFGAGNLSLQFSKIQQGQWDELVVQGSKAELQARRQQAQQRLELKLERNKQAQLDHKKALDKAATDRRIEVDQEKRNTIERLKQQELEAQKAEISTWQSTMPSQDQAESDYEEDDPDELISASKQDHADYHGRGWRPKKAKGMEKQEPADMQSQAGDQQTMWDSFPEHHEEQNAVESDDSSSTAYDASATTSQLKHADDNDRQDGYACEHAAPMRSSCQPVTVEFTKLETDHLPARETREQEISSYKRNAQDTPDSGDSLGMAERQPMFLKDKADAMHRAGNFRGAVNAYTKALHIDATLTACLSNRAASHLKLKDYRLCIEDCTTALDQLEAAMEAPAGQGSSAAAAANRTAAKLLARRAAAYAGLQDLKSAEADLKEALLRSPYDKQLQADIRELEHCQQPASSCNLRAIADQRFKQQDLHRAVDAYTAALGMPEASSADRLAALSNRAACRLAQGSFQDAVNDCTSACSVLTNQEVQSAEDMQAWLQKHTQGGDQLDVKQRQSLARLLARRCIALGQLLRYTAAEADLKAAQSLYIAMGQLDKADALESDLRKISSSSTYHS